MFFTSSATGPSRTSNIHYRVLRRIIYKISQISQSPLLSRMERSLTLAVSMPCQWFLKRGCQLGIWFQFIIITTFKTAMYEAHLMHSFIQLLSSMWGVCVLNAKWNAKSNLSWGVNKVQCVGDSLSTRQQASRSLYLLTTLVECSLLTKKYHVFHYSIIILFI